MRTAPLAALLVLVASPAAAQTFRRPVACDTCIANWYYFDNAASGLQDWNCGTSTYDGHRGSDFSLAGGNGAIASGWDVVAVAAGTVVSSEDGHYDHCSTCDASVDSRCGSGYGFGYGNHVVINHGSYRTIYAHMRTGSVRVGPGDTVTCGQVIGQIGSSGCTTGAHLHVETRPLGGAYTTAFDPFQGSCSPTSPSLWTSQGAYRGMPAPTCDGMPPPPMCPAGTYPIWTCNAARTQRRRCIDGVDTTEDCPYGCQSMPVGTDDTCAPAPDMDGDGSRADEDCDDGDPGRYPGNMEVCGDGVDQDCDGSDLACPGMDAGVPTTDAGV
ncbi:MAG: peptidoglycan DD-metalloendopeptidase family protein, partial [Myxococcales bacterium]|nr:peptidoglycan DD-metalloendopeptidase family protein [Myxococcales bacterium]